jgi:hypothetical protein
MAFSAYIDEKSGMNAWVIWVLVCAGQKVQNNSLLQRGAHSLDSWDARLVFRDMFGMDGTTTGKKTWVPLYHVHAYAF